MTQSRVSFPWEPEREFVPHGECCVATAIIGSAVMGAGASIYGSSQAASAQQAASQNATNAQLSMYNQTQGNLQPFIQGGQSAAANLSGLTGAGPGGNPLTAPLTAPFQPTMDQLASTPGYQFTRQQGLQATQNSFAAQGLGSSGAAMRGAANYAEGLAGTTYQQQLQNYMAQQAQAYNMLYGQSTQGSNAAAQLGTNATQVGGQIGSNVIGAGNAQAAAYMNQANAVSNLGGSFATAAMYNQLFGGQGGGGGGGMGAYGTYDPLTYGFGA